MQQRDVANYTDVKTITYNKEMWLIIRTTRHIQQRDVANYTDDKTYNKEMWLIIRTTIHTTKGCG